MVVIVILCLSEARILRANPITIFGFFDLVSTECFWACFNVMRDFWWIAVIISANNIAKTQCAQHFIAINGTQAVIRTLVTTHSRRDGSVGTELMLQDLVWILASLSPKGTRSDADCCLQRTTRRGSCARMSLYQLKAPKWSFGRWSRWCTTNATATPGRSSCCRTSSGSLPHLLPEVTYNPSSFPYIHLTFVISKSITWW